MTSMPRALLVLALLLLIGCSSETKSTQTPKAAEPAKQEKKEPILSTGREAFQKMYVSAHLWAPDARPYRLESSVNKESNGKDGKATIWRSGFASLSRRGLKSFLWSGSRLEDAPSIGVSSGVEDTYNPSNSSTQTFDFAFLKVDSDKAYEVALQHGGDKLMKAHPDQPVTYFLDWNGRENILTWHVIFGSDLQDAKLRIAVNASTGQFMKTEK
jgi:hypothetical protein